MFSKACKYAINAMIYISTLPGRSDRVSLRDISKAINSPEAFTAKILQVLVRENLLFSIKGPNGGFGVSEEGRKAYLYRIVEVIDGDHIFTGCALGLERCSEDHPCAVHNKFKAIREHLAGMMLTTSMEDMAKGIKDGTSFLKI
jgi:Rrf2 family protein